MIKPVYNTERVTVYHGDVLDILRGLPDETVQCVVTSPPYWGLRDYGITGQLGLEKTPEEYTEKMVTIFKEVRRVLHDQGTLWLNLGDSYASGGRGSHDRHREFLGPATAKAQELGRRIAPPGLKPKDLVGIPWRIAFALQADGWYLRSDIIWHKPNSMPESVIDRPTKAHEYLFLMSKNEQYYYDGKSIQEKLTTKPHSVGSSRHSELAHSKQRSASADAAHREPDRVRGASGGRNRRSVWTIPTMPFPGAHFAVFPQVLIEPCIKAGCRSGCMVLDPFMGSGTTGLVALKLGCKFIGIDLNREYIDTLAIPRLEHEEAQGKLF